MREILLFAEDSGHEAFLVALVERMAKQQDIAVTIRPYSVRGGHGTVLAELKNLRHEIQRKSHRTPDLLLIATDAKCQGVSTRRSEILSALSGIEVDIICAIPDPHIERWLLLDSEAFKRVLGRGCDAPDQKCIRDRYKVFLRNAILQAGRMPILGGLEHTYEIVNQMDLRRMESSGESLGTLIQELRRTLEGWTR